MVKKIYINFFICFLFFSSNSSYANEKLIKHGVLALEMEASQLYSIAARKGKKALAVLTVSDHVITHEAMDADTRERTLSDMVEVALAALSKN